MAWIWMTVLSHTYMRIGSKNQSKSFENLPFIQEGSMCKVVVKVCLLQRLVLLRVSQIICPSTLKRCLEGIARISTTPPPGLEGVNSFQRLFSFWGEGGTGI
jgi:hypothetical protein